MSGPRCSKAGPATPPSVGPLRRPTVLRFQIGVDGRPERAGRVAPPSPPEGALSNLRLARIEAKDEKGREGGREGGRERARTEGHSPGESLDGPLRAEQEGEGRLASWSRHRSRAQELRPSRMGIARESPRRKGGKAERRKGGKRRGRAKLPIWLDRISKEALPGRRSGRRRSPVARAKLTVLGARNERSGIQWCAARLVSAEEPALPSAPSYSPLSSSSPGWPPPLAATLPLLSSVFASSPFAGPPLGAQLARIDEAARW
ncbi:hypothetical protein KM043_000956 [Ampulex compressa]|nr:hypothetical protein KM043_000956 [Ampulex compressa]